MRLCYFLFALVLSLLFLPATAQLHWQQIDTGYGQLPASVKLYKTTDSLAGEPNIAFYLEADLNDRSLEFTTDTSYGRRLTPAQFAAKNDNPLAIINTTFSPSKPIRTSGWWSEAASCSLTISIRYIARQTASITMYCPVLLASVKTGKQTLPMCLPIACTDTLTHLLSVCPATKQENPALC